jgi:LCP family protein required for cell wall assembly
MLKKHFHYFAFVFLALSIVGCNLPYSQEIVQSASGAASFILVTPNPNASPTPTPFQPVPSTPRPTDLPTVTPTPTLEPSSTPTSIPTALPTSSLAPVSGSQMRIMVLGSDARPGGGYRTDIIMMVVINPSKGTVSALSFPRDLYVNIPGWGMNRINTAMEFGGFNLLASTLETNFGVRPTRYIMTTFNSFISIINSLGGVDVVASKTLSDKCKLKVPQNVNNLCTIRAGSTTHMNGDFALWYVRSRHTTSDIDRERRSQEVLQAMFQKLFSLNALTRIPELYDIYRKNVETNIGLDDVVKMAPVAAGLALDSSKIKRYSIGVGQVYDYTVPESGAMVLMPIEGAIQSMVRQALTP